MKYTNISIKIFKIRTIVMIFMKIYSEKLINDIRKITDVKILIHDNHKY